MLTIAQMTPAQAAQYFEEDNYYQQEDSQDNSEWWGEGAERLGLTGVVHPEVFEALAQGEGPQGQHLRGKPQHQQVQERAGDDLTFSAPKSLSLACLVNGDRRLEDAHRQAAKTAMEVVQARYAQTRIKGETEALQLQQKMTPVQ